MKAYPFQHRHPTTGVTTSSEGMDLRDYFAAACHDKIGCFPQHFTLNEVGNLTERQQAEFDRYIKASSKLAYQLADAMLEAREPKDEQS